MACLACQSKIGKSKKRGAHVGSGGVMMDDITKGALGLASTGVGLVAAFEATQAINNSSFKTENPDVVKYGVPIVGAAVAIGLPMLFDHGSDERQLAENFAYAFGGFALFDAYKNWRETSGTPGTPAVTGWDNQAYALKGADNRSYALAKGGVKGAVPNPMAKKGPYSYGVGATLPRPKAPAGMGF